MAYPRRRFAFLAFIIIAFELFTYTRQIQIHPYFEFYSLKQDVPVPVLSDAMNAKATSHTATQAPQAPHAPQAAIVQKNTTTNIAVIVAAIRENETKKELGNPIDQLNIGTDSNINGKPLDNKELARKQEEGRDTCVTTLSEKNLVNNDKRKSDNRAFSACLYWMDDYSRLVEWIAYHYQVLPLRNLIFFLDPNSHQDPYPIINRWRSLINITVWKHPSDFMGTKSLRKLHTKFNGRPDKDYRAYLFTQKEFYRQCSTQHKLANRTWTLYVDTDEYVVIKKDRVPNAKERMKEHGITWDLIREAHENHLQAKENTNRLQRDCITMSRKMYLSFESPQSMIKNNSSNHLFLDPYRLQTLRYRYSAKSKKTKPGKSIVDVSKYYFFNKKITPHKLLEDCVSPWGNAMDWMHVNHYIGSLEAYKRPGDARNMNRTQQWYESNEKGKKKKSASNGDEARPWIEGFVDYFGEEKTRCFLADAGYPFDEKTSLPLLRA